MSDIYGEQFYQGMRDGSYRSAGVVVPLVLELVKPCASVVDVGCGTGAWLARFREHGVKDLCGLEFSAVGAHLAHIGREHIRMVDLSRPFRLERIFDLVVSLEVAEHLPEEAAAGLVESLAGLGPVVLFSAAVPGQGGTNHLNEQWPSYWARRFAENGFEVVDCLRNRIWRDERIEWWYRQNLLLFVRRDLAPQYARHLPEGLPPALDRMMPYGLHFPGKEDKAVPLGDRAAAPATGAMILSRNGAGRIEHCLESIRASGFAEEIVVCVDRETTDRTAEIARRFTSQVHLIEVHGTVESVLPEMAGLCAAEYVLRIDDDEALGGDWDRGRLEVLMRFNHLTHLIVPRRWLVFPGDRFLAGEPWFPDLQIRLFRNDPKLIAWPPRIHDPMVVRGRGLTAFDRWIEHYDLILKSRPEREKKCQYYRGLRPEKHLSEFYLFEEEEIRLLPADPAGFQAAVEAFTAGRKRGGGRAAPAYHPGGEILFHAGGNAAHYTTAGWWDPESWGTWTNGRQAEIYLPLETALEGPALLTVEAGAYVHEKHPVLQVRVFCGQTACGQTELGKWSIDTHEPVERRLTVPAPAIPERELWLRFDIENPAAPEEFGESDDYRLLGLGVRRIRVEPA